MCVDIDEPPAVGRALRSLAGGELPAPPRAEVVQRYHFERVAGDLLEIAAHLPPRRTGGRA
jgi:hypothetical protein